MNDLTDLFYAGMILLMLSPLLWLTWGFWKAAARHRADEDRSEWAIDDRCAECGYDLRAGHEVCPECGAPVPTEADRARERGYLLDPHALSADWPIDAITPRRPAPHEMPLTVHSTVNGLEANLLVKQLNARGVLATLQTKDEYQIKGAFSQTIRCSFVVVPSDDEEIAKAIVDRFRWKQPPSTMPADRL